jgi:hypothetical protein
LPLNPSDVRYNWDTALLYDTAGPTEKFTRVFNNTGRELSELNYVMDAGNWVVFSRVRITYDVSGNLLTLLTESWDKAGNGWANLKRNRFAYDANGNSTNGNCEEWKAGAWGPGMSSISVYSQQKLVYTFWWPLHYQYQATFTSYSSGVNEIDNSMALSVFPNPAGEKLTIVCKNLKPGQQVAIYDLHGRLILQSSITRSNYELDISRLSPGNFLIRLGSGTEAGCAHFIKK